MRVRLELSNFLPFILVLLAHEARSVVNGNVMMFLASPLKKSISFHKADCFGIGVQILSLISSDRNLVYHQIIRCLNTSSIFTRSHRCKQLSPHLSEPRSHTRAHVRAHTHTHTHAHREREREREREMFTSILFLQQQMDQSHSSPSPFKWITQISNLVK